LARIAIWRECCVFNGKPVLYQWLVWSRLSGIVVFGTTPGDTS
jgi:hypothetical protein